MLWRIIRLAVSSLPSAAFGAPYLKASRYSRSCRPRDFMPVDNFYDRKKNASGEQPYALAVARRMPHGLLMALAERSHAKGLADNGEHD